MWRGIATKSGGYGLMAESYWLRLAENNSSHGDVKVSSRIRRICQMRGQSNRCLGKSRRHELCAVARKGLRSRASLKPERCYVTERWSCCLSWATIAGGIVMKSKPRRKSPSVVPVERQSILSGPRPVSMSCPWTVRKSMLKRVLPEELAAVEWR